METVPEPSEPAGPKQPPVADRLNNKLQFYGRRPIKQPPASSAQLATGAELPKLQYYGQRPIEQPSFASIIRKAQTIGRAEEPPSIFRIGLWPPDELKIQNSGIIEVQTIVLHTRELNGTWSSASLPGLGGEWNFESKTLTLVLEVVPT